VGTGRGGFGQLWKLWAVTLHWCSQICAVLGKPHTAAFVWQLQE